MLSLKKVNILHAFQWEQVVHMHLKVSQCLVLLHLHVVVIGRRPSPVLVVKQFFNCQPEILLLVIQRSQQTPFQQLHPLVLVQIDAYASHLERVRIIPDHVYWNEKPRHCAVALGNVHQPHQLTPRWRTGEFVLVLVAFHNYNAVSQVVQEVGAVALYANLGIPRWIAFVPCSVLGHEASSSPLGEEVLHYLFLHLVLPWLFGLAPLCAELARHLNWKGFAPLA